MNLKGHELYVINSHWLFDLTTYTGYRTSKNRKGELNSIVKAYKVKYNQETKECKFTKFITEIPLGTLRKSRNIIKHHLESVKME